MVSSSLKGRKDSGGRGQAVIRERCAFSGEVCLFGSDMGPATFGEGFSVGRDFLHSSERSSWVRKKSSISD